MGYLGAQYHASNHYGSLFYRQTVTTPSTQCNGYFRSQHYAAQHYASQHYRGTCAAQACTGYPSASDVRLGVVYGPNNEYTGTLVLTGGGSIALMRRR